jgi:hypothetical protein
MSILRNIDGYDAVRNFERVYFGPGVYILIDGRAADKNITYIGKSTAEIMARVSAHRDKVFDKVAVILPRSKNKRTIHNLEAAVVEEYVDMFDELPEFNKVQPRFMGRHFFNWKTLSRRKSDVLFE